MGLIEELVVAAVDWDGMFRIRLLLFFVLFVRMHGGI